MNGKILRLLALLACTFPLTPFCIAADKIKIGVPAPLTADGAIWGQDMRDSLLFANEEFGKGAYELIFEDDKCDPKEGVLVIQKLLHVDKVSHLLGFGCSGPTMAALPLAQKAKIPTVVITASSPQIAQAGDYIFRTFPSDTIAAKTLYAHVSKKYRRVGILSSSVQFPQDLKDAFVAENRTGNLSITTADYAPNQRDFKGELARLKKEKPEIIFINPQDESSFMIAVRQIDELKLNVARLGAYFPGSAALFPSHAAQLEGVEFVDTPSASSLLTTEGKSLYDKFLATGRKLQSVEMVFLASVEGFRALDTAIRKGGNVRDNLAATDYTGMFGPVSFDQDGEIKGLSFQMRRIENGKIIDLQ